MDYVCGDNRFEIIERYKNELISATNIESLPEEMAVLDNILFRFWQMGWLKEQEAEWLEVDDKHDAFDCSNCGAMAGRKCLYCPGCGAKMKNGTRAMEGR